MENIEFTTGDIVVKISGKPFKNREKEDVIESFGINEQDPKKRDAAFLKYSKTWVNLEQLIKIKI